MDERNKSFWLGIFIIGALALVAWFFLFLKPQVGDGKLKLSVLFSNVDKISRGTRVTYGGMLVGEVYQIKPAIDQRSQPIDENGNYYLFEVILKVDSSVKIYSYDEILFTTAGLMGEKSIAIIPKAPPFGALTARDVTDSVLYGRSQDKLELMVKGVTDVTENLQDSMSGINELIVHVNETDVIDRTLNTMTSLNVTLSSADSLFREVLEEKLIHQMLISFEKAERSFDLMEHVFERVACGDGTLGRLLYSDSLYLQLSATLCKFSTVLNDIENFGLLFQYNKGWQRQRAQKINRLSSLCAPCDFYHAFDDEISRIQITLDRIGTLLETMENKQIPIENGCFTDSFCELMSRVEALQNTLKLYTEMMMAEYCQKCRCP